MEAQALMAQGVDPRTNQPVDPNQLMAMIEDAALMPLPFESKQTHLQVLGLFLKSPEYDQLPPDAQQRMYRHYELTAQALAAETPPDPKTLPGLSVAARSTVSAPVMTEILKKHGIEVTEEQVTEAPLETAVYDSTDKMDQSAAGNNPLEDWEKMAAIQQQEDAHSVAQAKAQHDLQLSVDKGQREAELHAQKMRFNEEDFAQKQELAQQQAALAAVHQDEMHDANVEQARKPKPAAGKSSGR